MLIFFFKILKDVREKNTFRNFEKYILKLHIFNYFYGDKLTVLPLKKEDKGMTGQCDRFDNILVLLKITGT